MVFTSSRSSNFGFDSGYSGQGVTKGEYEILKEEKLQTYRAIDLEILDIKNDTKLVEKDTALVGLETAEVRLDIAGVNRDMALVDLEVAEINLETHQIDVDIALERHQQKEDEFVFEQFQTGIKRANYVVQGNMAVAQLEAAAQELDELLDLNQLKYVDYNPQLDQLPFSDSMDVSNMGKRAGINLESF